MKIAILTIHKITNYGSALQTYALQSFIEKNINDSSCTILDYKFPNSYHWKERYKKMSLLKVYRNKLHRIRESLSYSMAMKKAKFKHFWFDYYHLSQPYNSQNSILELNPKDYDIYILGSDQVWNARTLCGDKIFLFAHLSEHEKCFSYASSFGLTYLPEEYTSLFKKELSKFRAIGVREKKAVDILSTLGYKDKTMLVCDPTLLLDANEYEFIANKSSCEIDGDYILVYCLQYAFNPYPAIRNVISELQKKYKYKIVFIGKEVNGTFNNTTVLNSIGPCEFVYLFRNAKIVVTSSFHGTAFSIINRKPFVSIAPRRGDSRIGDLLTHVGLEKNLIYNDQNNIDFNDDPYTNEAETKIATYINDSKNFLISNINKLRNEGIQ